VAGRDAVPRDPRERAEVEDGRVAMLEPYGKVSAETRATRYSRRYAGLAADGDARELTLHRPWWASTLSGS